jgi:hypothetical protein
MTSWKAHIQVRDLDDRQKLEMTCRACGHVHYLTRAIICAAPEREFLYLDEIERDTICRARGCRGRVRLSIQSNSKTSGFVGGMA